MSKSGHALRRENVQNGDGHLVYHWTCECGEEMGQQPAMSVHRVRAAHREHKVAAS